MVCFSIFLPALCVASDDGVCLASQHPGDLTASTEAGEFPATDLFDALQRGDTVRMRRHAWNLFAGLTSQDSVVINKTLVETSRVKAPIFLSWYTKTDLFTSAANGPSAKSMSLFGLEFPRQFLDLGVPKDPARKPVVLDKVYYNLAACQHISANGLNKPAARVRRNCDFGQAPPEDRHVPAFPPSAVAVKAIWTIASKSRLTPLPVWDPESNSAQPGGNDPMGTAAGRWTRYVAVNTDPTKYVGTQTFNVQVWDDTAHRFDVHRARVVPVSSFFRIQITPEIAGAAAEVAEALAISEIPLPGDYLILVGLHVTTKEIPNWVWATFWWHDQPDRGPHAAQRPSSILDPWNNYLMNVSYDMNDPRESDGTAHINFNPYLEAAADGGVKSNCMTCHRLAAVPRIAPTRTPGAISIGDPRFSGKMKTDFLWTLTDDGDIKINCKPQ